MMETIGIVIMMLVGGGFYIWASMLMPVPMYLVTLGISTLAYGPIAAVWVTLAWLLVTTIGIALSFLIERLEGNKPI